MLLQCGCISHDMNPHHIVNKDLLCIQNHGLKANTNVTD